MDFQGIHNGKCASVVCDNIICLSQKLKSCHFMPFIAVEDSPCSKRGGYSKNHVAVTGSGKHKVGILIRFLYINDLWHTLVLPGSFCRQIEKIQIHLQTGAGAMVRLCGKMNTDPVFIQGSFHIGCAPWRRGFQCVVAVSKRTGKIIFTLLCSMNKRHAESVFIVFCKPVDLGSHSVVQSCPFSGSFLKSQCVTGFSDFLFHWTDTPFPSCLISCVPDRKRMPHSGYLLPCRPDRWSDSFSLSADLCIRTRA